MQPAATADVTAGEIIAAFGVSVTTPFLLTALIAPAMAQRGDGAIVNIGSISGITGAEGSARSTQWHPARSPPNANEEFADAIAPVLARVPSHRMSTVAE